MKIVQISDLHIDENFNFDKYKEMLSQMIDCINAEINEEKVCILSQ